MTKINNTRPLPIYSPASSPQKSSPSPRRRILPGANHSPTRSPKRLQKRGVTILTNSPKKGEEVYEIKKQNRPARMLFTGKKVLALGKDKAGAIAGQATRVKEALGLFLKPSIAGANTIEAEGSCSLARKTKLMQKIRETNGNSLGTSFDGPSGLDLFFRHLDHQGMKNSEREKYISDRLQVLEFQVDKSAWGPTEA